MISDEGITKQKLENFRFLMSDDSVKHVMEQVAFYGFSGDRVKGHIFCSRINEAKWLTKEELDSVAWLPADITLIEKVRAAM